MTPLASPDPRALLADLFRAAVTAVAPDRAVRAALASDPPEPKRRVHIVALGKAAHPMAAAAVAALEARGQSPAGGLLVVPEPAPAPHAALDVVTGDHPEPGTGSLLASQALAAAAARVAPGDEVWVLLSGGTTSLVGAPVPGITPGELAQLYRILLASGLDIHAMNQVRKRFTRWSGGRLATSLYPARVKNFTISDVIGDDLASIGSGPCVPDETTAAEVRSILTRAELWEKIPESMRRLVAAVERGEQPETPKPGDPGLGHTTTRVIASNRLALEAARSRAEALGLTASIEDTALAGEAASIGQRLATTLVNYAAPPAPAQDALHTPLHNHAALIWGGETTVTLGTNPGLGGRNQELALAAARRLHQSDRPVTLLAAGTDGRDGPTDAAGAFADQTTWRRISAARRDPGADLTRHNAYPALDAAGDLFRTGLTGTNVMDVVVGVVRRER